ncbi:MAG: hypothetical protein IPP88_18865 [Betaproteobacteria bacterium]|nr:hypothetical protein [Betaproteobacteria bacterium]
MKKKRRAPKKSKARLSIDFQHRIALIQVDGKQTVEVLLSKIPGDGFASIEKLWRDGFIPRVEGRRLPLAHYRALPISPLAYRRLSI